MNPSKTRYQVEKNFTLHVVGTINFARYEEIINSDIIFIMVVYEKIFGGINKLYIMLTQNNNTQYIFYIRGS